MKYQKGHSGNPQGRPKGAKGRVKQSVKDWIQNVIDANRNQFAEDLAALSPKERVVILEKLISYVVPKQQAVNANVELSKLSDEQLNSIIGELTKDIEL